MPVHVCMPCVFVGICVSVPWVCVCCSIQLETSNPTFLFHCLNERVKRLLVVITVINDFFSSFRPMKSALTSSTFPSAAGCGLFCKEIPLFMFKWVLHYVLLFNHWPFYALHFPWVYRCAWVCLCRITSVCWSNLKCVWLFVQLTWPYIHFHSQPASRLMIDIVAVSQFTLYIVYKIFTSQMNVHTFDIH